MNTFAFASHEHIHIYMTTPTLPLHSSLCLLIYAVTMHNSCRAVSSQERAPQSLWGVCSTGGKRDARRRPRAAQRSPRCPLVSRRPPCSPSPSSSSCRSAVAEAIPSRSPSSRACGAAFWRPPPCSTGSWCGGSSRPARSSPVSAESRLRSSLRGPSMRSSSSLRLHCCRCCCSCSQRCLVRN